MDQTRAIPGALPTVWRQRAAYLEQFGDPTSARLWKLAAVELEHALKAFGDEPLTLVDAAQLSGYTADHLGWLVKTKKIPNAGRKHAPRIRRTDLPMKSSTPSGRPSHPTADTDRVVTNISKLTRRRKR